MIRERLLKFNWRLSLAHIVVNTLALGLTFLILPGLYIVHPNKLVALIVAGLVFGLLNAFVRPLLQFAMFNFLFATFGLVLVIINFILLVLLGQFMRNWFGSDSWWSVLFAAVLIGVFGVILENVLGLTPPVVEHAPQQQRTQTVRPVLEERLMEFLEDDDTGEATTAAPVATEVSSTE